MKNFAVVFLFLSLPFLIFSQETKKRPEVTNGLNVGFNVHSFGLGVGVQYLKKLGSNDLLIEGNFSSFKGKKEEKIESVYSDQNGKDFIFDKKNALFALSGGVGLSKKILPLGNHNKVSLRVSGSIGPTLGFEKPYYLEIAVPVSPTEARVVEEQYDSG